MIKLYVQFTLIRYSISFSITTSVIGSHLLIHLWFYLLSNCIKFELIPLDSKAYSRLDHYIFADTFTVQRLKAGILNCAQWYWQPLKRSITKSNTFSIQPVNSLYLGGKRILSLFIRWQRGFYTIGILKSARISRLAEIPTIYCDWLRSFN